MNEPTNDQVNDAMNDAMNDTDWWASRLVDHEIAFADVPAELRSAVQSRVKEFDAQRRTLNRLGLEHRVDPELTARAVATAMRAPDAIVVPLRRRLAPFAAVAAASIAVVVIGVSVLRSDDRPDVVAIDATSAETFADPTPAVGDDADARSSAPAEVAPTIDGNTLAMTTDTAALEAGAPDTASADVATPRAPMPNEVTEIADMIELAAYLEQWRITPPALLEGAAACEDDEGRPAIALNVRFAGIEAQAYFSPEAGVMLLAVADCLKLASIVP